MVAMSNAVVEPHHRILIVDDNRAIHGDIRKILAPPAPGKSALRALEAELFGEIGEIGETGDEEPDGALFEIDSAYQGEEGLGLLQRSLHEGKPYALAFVDVRMPPGWDGVETVSHMWREDPDVQIVLCTAYSDHSWSDIVRVLGHHDGLVVLKKPFDNIEVSQLAHALTRKWALQRRAQRAVESLEIEVRHRTAELERANAELKVANGQLEQEMLERKRVEVELNHAQKLEAVGQLAAGIAHEINTPIQYLGDSAHFLRGSFADLQGLVATYRRVCATLCEESGHEGPISEVLEAEEAADLPYLEAHVPRAFDRAFDGIERVATIVRAMKEFAHPDQREMSPADVNRALATTLTVARNEYKYVADIETDFGDLPLVVCHIGDLNQVFLNLVVNAAHAIADAGASEGTKGRIEIRTGHEGDAVTVSVGDTGCGIPEGVRQRVFDPFFTTKEVGRGTGQGLAIARSIVVDRHGGTLTFETEIGKGTTFTVRLLVEGPSGASRKGAP